MTVVRLAVGFGHIMI